MDSSTAFPYSEFLLLRWDKLQFEYDLSFNVKGCAGAGADVVADSHWEGTTTVAAATTTTISMTSEHDHAVVAIDIDLLDCPVVVEDDDCCAFSSIPSTSMDDT